MSPTPSPMSPQSCCAFFLGPSTSSTLMCIPKPNECAPWGHSGPQNQCASSPEPSTSPIPYASPNSRHIHQTLTSPLWGHLHLRAPNPLFLIPGDICTSKPHVHPPWGHPGSQIPHATLLGPFTSLNPPLGHPQTSLCILELHAHPQTLLSIIKPNGHP